MNTFTEKSQVEVIPMSLRHYLVAYRPESVNPEHVYPGRSNMVRDIRRGFTDLDRYRDEIAEVHLVDRVWVDRYGETVHLKGVRIYGEDERYIACFPDLSLYGGALSVAAVYQLLEILGLNEKDVDRLYRATYHDHEQRVDGNSVKTYNHSLVIMFK